MCKKLLSLLKTTLTWWNGQTVGTWLYTKRKGHFVGEDQAGNRYYHNGDLSRRWVIYKDISDASCVPPQWHAWLHKITHDIPSQENFPSKSWHKPHQENLTGTVNAYAPPSSLTNDVVSNRRKSTGDYEAWKP